MSSYCDTAPGHPWHGPYHAKEYGFPLHDDQRLFERLVLEIMQAGLSWLTILKKKQNFKRAFDGFDIDRVASYGEPERQRLLADAGIIRNRLKIDAVIENARKLVKIRQEFGSFETWLDQQQSLNKEQWVQLFRQTFRFTGGEITGEFLMSTGYLPDAHKQNCPVYAEILRLNPRWLSANNIKINF